MGEDVFVDDDAYLERQFQEREYLRLRKGFLASSRTMDENISPINHGHVLGFRGQNDDAREEPPGTRKDARAIGCLFCLGAAEFRISETLSGKR